MQKKIIALAIAAALVTPAAFADTGNVTVYGVVDADFESVKNSIPGAATAATALTAATSRNRVNSNASRLGVKGEEDLGDGLKAIYQIETRLNLAGNEPASGTNAGTASVFNGIRNSNVGLKGGFGTVFLGVWDTPFKTAHNPVEVFDNAGIATALNVIGTVTGTTANQAVGYTLRQNSSVQYWTPVIGGFQGKLAYSTANAAVAAGTANTNANGATVAATGATAFSTTQTPKLVSLSAAYDVEQFYAAYAYDSHQDFRGANLKDTGNRLVGAYKFGDGQVGLTYDRLTVADTTTTTVSRSAWELSGKYKFGASNLGAFYTKAGNVGGVVNTGAKQFSVRYGYNFSKRTEAYALYTALTNDTGAAYGLVDAANGVTAGLGSKVSGFGVGLRQSF